MKSKKLMNLGRRRSLKPQLDWLEQKRIELKESVISPSSVLLTQNFAEWCETLKIKTPQGLRPFTLFDWQRETARLIVGDAAMKGRTIVVLSSRQTGKTSMFLALGAYLSQATAQHTGVLIHKTQKDAGLLARRLKRFLSGVKLRTDSLGLLEFLNDSMLHFRSSNPARGEQGAEGAGRGLDSVDIVIIEEAGHTSNLAAVQGVIGPALTWGNPKISVLIGTAGSELSRYYSLLSQSAGGAAKLEKLLDGIRAGTEEPFQILNLGGPGPIGVVSNWRCIPEFAAETDFLGRVQRELNLSDEQIAAEYEMHFSAGGDQSVFDFALVMAAISGELDSVSEDIDRYGIYYVGIDPAGAGEDFTVCCVIQKLNKQKFRVAAFYRKRKGTSEQHLSRIAEMIRLYYPQHTLCESNSLGQLYVENLTSVSPGISIGGHHTSQQSKELIVGKINLALEQGAIAFPKGDIPDELLSFRRTGANSKRLEAAPGAHDDCVIALGLALHAARFGKV